MSEVLHYVSLPTCSFCGGDLADKLINDESITYCLDCGRTQPESSSSVVMRDEYELDRELRMFLSCAGRIYSIIESNPQEYDGIRFTPEYKMIRRFAETQDTTYEKFNALQDEMWDRVDNEIKRIKEERDN